MTTSYLGENKVMNLAKAKSSAAVVKAVFRTANNKARCAVMGIAQDAFMQVIKDLVVDDPWSIRQLPTGQIIWKGGVILVPYIVTDRAKNVMPEWSHIMCLNDQGEIVYGI